MEDSKIIGEARAGARAGRAAMDFGNQTVIVTGAAGNLGRAVVQAFARRGANIVAIDVEQRALAEHFGGDTAEQLLLAADLREQAQADMVAQRAIERFSRIDVLCNIAGAFRMGEPVHATTDRTWQLLFDVNARTVLTMARAVVPRMLAAGRGRIISVAAFAALHGAANMGAYTASKAVVMRLTEAMSAELRERGINVNCVLPTIIDTPANRADMPDADPARWVAPEALAEAIVFLASDAARAIHGAALPVTGLS